MVIHVCVVFARPEILSLIREGAALGKILARLWEGVADRVGGLIPRV